MAEVSSFQLEHTRQFRPDVSCWLNFAPDHLDWHPSLEHYARAKVKIWANQGPGCVAVLNADDSTVLRAAAKIPAGVEVISFGAELPGPVACEPRRDKRARLALSPAGDLPRALPHDLSNTAAALAVALAGGASPEGCRRAAATTLPPAHRVQLVGESGGVAWYDDSKATTPAAVIAGVSGFASVVLIAGGRNKGLDLSDLASTVPPVRAVVAIGEASDEVTSAFSGTSRYTRRGRWAKPSTWR